MAETHLAARISEESGIGAGLRETLELCHAIELGEPAVARAARKGRAADRIEELLAEMARGDDALARLGTELGDQRAQLAEIEAGLGRVLAKRANGLGGSGTELLEAGSPPAESASADAEGPLSWVGPPAQADAAESARVSARSAPAAFVRYGVLTLLVGLLGLTIWAGTVDYGLRVTSDTPTFIALVSDMGQRPLAEQSPFLAQGGVATQHATPYMQALGFLWRFLDLDPRRPVELARLLALVGIGVFAFTLYAVFLYVRRLAGVSAAWLSLPILLGLFGPPHVIWASDLTLHGALYAGFFPQNLAIALALLTLLALGRRTRASLVLACLLAAGTMLVHPFTGVLLSVLAAAESCVLARRRDGNYLRAPVALTVGFAVGAAWPAYSLDRAFAETSLRGIFLVALCAAAPFAVRRLRRLDVPGAVRRASSSIGGRLETSQTAFKLAILGVAGTVGIAVWELLLVHWPPADSPRLAIYWVDERWRWPLLLAAGTVGVSGLVRLARRGHTVPAVWFAGCLALGVAGALGLPLPVWYRFLLLCQIPLAVGVAVVLAEAGRSRTTAVVVATFALAIGVKVLTLVAAPPTVSYFGRPLQAAWSLGDHVPAEPGLVATDPNTAYFVPAVTGHRVLTVGKGHAGSKRELDAAEEGYRLLRRFYAGGPGWWTAAREMWRRGVRYVIVEKHTTLEPRRLSDFTWQAAMLRTPAQRHALGNYFYENNRVGTLLYDSPEYVVYRLDRRKLFGPHREQAR